MIWLRVLAVMSVIFLVQASVEQNDNAIAMFTLLTTQQDGGNVTDVYNMMVDYSEDGKFSFTYHAKILFLAIGGMDEGKSLDAINKILPALAKEGKSVHEQVTALLLMSGKYCPENNFNGCKASQDLILPMMTMDSSKGCGADGMKSNRFTRNGDVCLCNNQDDVLLMMDMTNKMFANTSVDDDASLLALMMLMNQLTCSGYLVRDQSIPCECNKITLGQDAFLMHHLLTDERITKSMKEDERQKALSLARQPQTRSSELTTALMSSLGTSIDPTLMSLVSQGDSSTDLFKNVILAQMGLDPATTYLFLNGGFKDKDNKVAMINYFANMGVFPPDMIPFILGVDDGFTFYINSLLTAGAIDPLLGLLMLSTKSNVDQKDVLTFIIDYIMGGMNPDYLANLGKPYIPPLPYGIYPGSELYFVHFESLEINTCSLHSLENRFDCGYVGINAAACEIKPYCCYNPVFLSDERVSSTTNGVITSALDIPWCYFNIFFIYYDQFHLNVLRPGKFASKASCKGLYKYNLDLQPTLYHLSTGSNSLLSQLVYERKECGFPGITEFHCVAIRGCCWDKYAPNQVPQCYEPNGPTTLDFNLDTIPTAYLPMDGTCSTNYYQSPILYYRRVACHYTIDYAKYGFNILQPPTQKDCLWNLGCCWEDNPEVLRKYPNTPQCYQRENGTFFNVLPSTLPDVSQLLARSGVVGENDEIEDSASFIKERQEIHRRHFAEKGFPPVEKQLTVDDILEDIESKPKSEAAELIKKLFSIA